MSYVALATDRYDEVIDFYGKQLGFPVVDQWERPNARGVRFDLGGMRLEILDNHREPRPLSLGKPGDRVHVVVEVDDIEEARAGIQIDAPPAQATSWGAHLFQLRDPDDVPVTFLQWVEQEQPKARVMRGRVVSGEGKGAHFTQLSWAREQFVDRLGIDPYPGTVNLIVADPDSRSALDELKKTPGIGIDNPNRGPSDCDARCFPVSIEGHQDAAIVLPSIAHYPPDQVEVISATGIRGALGIEDGDSLTLQIKPHRASPEATPAKAKT